MKLWPGRRQDAVRSVARVHRSFRWPRLSGRLLIKHLSAGVLMGVGAAIASGGNDSQLLLTLPALSPAGWATVASMILGIVLGRKLV